MLNVVIDTNIFISALMGGKIARTVVDALIDSKSSLVISAELFNELTLTVNKPRLAPFIQGENVTLLISFIKTKATFVKPLEEITICRDPEDNKVLEAAVAGNADVIVTGDKDLLVLKSFQGIPIVTPKIFVASLRGK